MVSLYERLGGQMAIEALAEILYDEIYSDPSLSVFFVGKPKEMIVAKQVAFLSHVLGGPEMDKSIDLTKAHQSSVKQGMSEVHFNKVATIIVTSLEQMDVADEDIAELATALTSMKDAVLGR